MRAADCEAIVMGVSAGGLLALSALLSGLPKDYPIPIIIVQHRAKMEGSLLEEVLQTRCAIHVKEADEKEAITGGRVYLAPADYHLLVERNRHFSLSCDAPVLYSRPSIDVLFETAADTYGPALTGIVLTGANHDGAAGLRRIKQLGGTTIVQDPETAQFPAMPRAAIATGSVDYVLSLDALQLFLSDLGVKNRLS